MKRLLMAGGLVAALAVGAVAVASAQEDGTPTPVPEASEDAQTDERGERRDDFLDRLAENLGVSRDDLDGAIDDTQLELIDQALADGKIDEEKAAELRERVENGDPLFPGFGGGGPMPHIRHVVVSFVDIAADVLGMENDDLVEQLRDGDQSLADVAEAQGVDVEEFKADLLAAAKAKLDEKVADGDLDQEHADDFYARFSENIDDIVNNAHPGPRFPGPGPGRHFRGGPFGGGPFEDAVPLPEDGANFDFGIIEEEITAGA